MIDKVAVYICNNDYIWLTKISMISLVEHNENIHVYVFGPNITQNNKTELIKIAQSYGSICSVEDLPDKFSRKIGKRLRWPNWAISRLFLSELLPEAVQKALYLDSDTLILGNLNDLWDYDMHENMFCGVKDCISWRYKRNIGLEKEDIYVNGGVLLVNLTSMREAADCWSSVHKFFLNHLYETSYYDQDVLNFLFRNKIGVLKPQYNVMTVIVAMSHQDINRYRHPANFYAPEEISHAKVEPSIIHFTQQVFCQRPWIQGSTHPFYDTFWHYANMLGMNKSSLLIEKNGHIQSLLSRDLLNDPSAMKKILLCVFGFLHAVYLPVIRHARNKLYLMLKPICKGGI